MANDGHCWQDKQTCRGPSYCACQCNTCFRAYYGRDRTDDERAMLLIQHDAATTDKGKREK